MSATRFTFGPRLKAHREGRGIPLQHIADSTKIGMALLAALERNDLSQWPKGIFRRAFLRAYAKAIDIPFEPVWAEFVQLFPEDGAPPASRFSDGTPLRMTLAGARTLVAPTSSSVFAALADATFIIICALAVARVTGSFSWSTLAVMSLVYTGVSTALTGVSPATLLLRRMRARHPAALTAPVAARGDDHQEQQPAPVAMPPPSMPLPLTFDEPDGALPLVDSPVAPSRRPRIVTVPLARLKHHEAPERRVADR